MADRHAMYPGRSVMPPRGGTESFPGARSSASAPTSANLRRNLFQNHLTRRQPSGAPSVLSAAMASADMGRGTNVDMAAGAGRKLSEPPGASIDIIARDVHGELQMADPPSPAPDELKDMALDERQENDRERQRLADTIKYHQQRSSLPGQPEELLEAIRASLRAKVAALADDNWMYEAEYVPRLD